MRTTQGLPVLVLCVLVSCGGKGGDGDTPGVDSGPDPQADPGPADAPGDAPGDPLQEPGGADLPGDAADAPGPVAEVVRAQVIAAVMLNGDPVAFAALCDDVGTVLGAAPPAAGEPADARQARCLAMLAFALDRPDGWVRTRAGTMRGARLDLEATKAVLGAGVTATDVATRAIRALGPLLRVPDADRAFRMVRNDAGDHRSLLFRQVAKDVPVFGSFLDATVIERADTFVLRGLSGKFVPDLALPAVVEPAVGAGGAEAAIARARSLGPGDLVPIVPPRLWVFDGSLFQPECPACPVVRHAARLAWKVVYSAPQTGGITVDAFVDAETGEVLFHVPRTDGEDLRVSTASGLKSYSCYASDCRVGIDPWYDEDGVCESWTGPCWGDNHCWWGRLVFCAEPDAEGARAYALVRDTYEFFRDEFPSGADLGADDPYIAFVHSCAYGDSCPWENAASWDCAGWSDVHTFGDGYVQRDIVGHEAGHTWNRYLTNYVNTDESGANAEHVSDLMGIFAACRAGDDCDWWHGEHAHDAVGPDCGRHPANPSDCSDPDHWDSYVRTTSDNGGVHTNSTILSHAAWFFTEGGVQEHDMIEVRGLGMAKAKRLVRVAVPGLPEDPGFRDVAERFVFACDSLVGTDPLGFSEDDCCQVRKAYQAVGVERRDSDCDGTPDSAETDPDDDGLGWMEDNCNTIPNPDQANLDGDLSGDACDPDDDGDGVLDGDDNCPRVDNGDQADGDGDGRGDACEDGDGDGLYDGQDVCPALPNPDQADLDLDGRGDPCDPDDDGDGIPEDGDPLGHTPCTPGHVANCDDNCRRIANADQADADGDGVGDACDNCPALVSTDRGDLDGDGLGDPCDDDRDGDGVANDDDECPSQAASRTGMRVCPTGTSCRPGCPDTRAVVPGLAARIEAAEIADLPAGEGPLPILGMELDTCAFVDCTGPGVLDTELVLGLKVSMALDPTLAMESPVTVSLVLVDESGRKRARATANLVSNATQHVPEADVELRSTVMPSFAGRYLAALPPPTPDKAAVPALHLLVTVLPGNAANTTLLRTMPITLTVKGGGGGDVDAALKECARLGLKDYIWLMNAFWHHLDYINQGGPLPADVLDMTSDRDQNGSQETRITGTVTGSDWSDGLQKNEVAVFTFDVAMDQVPAGSGGISFVKLSEVDNTFRSTMVKDTSLDLQPACGPLAFSSMGVHGKPHLVYPNQWYGMIEYRATVEGHWLDALVVFTEGRTSAALTGTTDQGVPVEMEIVFNEL